MDRKAEIRRECGLLAEQAAKKIGASAWYEHAEKVLTADEKVEVRELWDTMSGGCSWMNAFLTWMQAS